MIFFQLEFITFHKIISVWFDMFSFLYHPLSPFFFFDVFVCELILAILVLELINPFAKLSQAFFLGKKMFLGAPL